FVSLQTGVLTAGAVVSLAMGGVIDALLIGGVVLANGIIGYYMESKAERVIFGLNQGGKGSVEVYRDGKICRLPTRELVPGDLIHLVRGDVPADCRILKARHLTVDESMLTGESEPILKRGSRLPSTDERDLVWKGTTVVGGAAVGL